MVLIFPRQDSLLNIILFIARPTWASPVCDNWRCMGRKCGSGLGPPERQWQRPNNRLHHSKGWQENNGRRLTELKDVCTVSIKQYWHVWIFCVGMVHMHWTLPSHLHRHHRPGGRERVLLQDLLREHVWSERIRHPNQKKCPHRQRRYNWLWCRQIIMCLCVCDLSKQCSCMRLN